MIVEKSTWTDSQAGRQADNHMWNKWCDFFSFCLSWWVFSDPHYQETGRPTYKQVQLWISELSTVKQKALSTMLCCFWVFFFVVAIDTCNDFVARKTTTQRWDILCPIILWWKIYITVWLGWPSLRPGLKQVKPVILTHMLRESTFVFFVISIKY